MNLFVVVETGDHHISVLDGDRFEVIDRFPTPIAVHGGPKFSPDGHFVFVMSRDGWVQKYDLWSLAEVGRVRAGLNSRNIAISKDGKWLAVANYLPATLTILAADDLSVARVIDVAGRDGTPSRVSAVYQAPPRDSFILALKDAPEIWEIATDPEAPPVHAGFVHSHEAGMEEALGASGGLFALRRIAVGEPIDDFFFTPDYRHLIGASRQGDRGIVVNLNVGREIAELPLPGMPHLGSGITWMRDGRRVMATPHLHEPRLSVIDIDSWEVVAHDRDRRSGLLPAQPRIQPLCLGRRLPRADPRHDPRHRQAEPGDRGEPDAGAGRRRRPCGVRPMGAPCAGQRLGGRRRADRLRRRDAGGGEAAADAQARPASTTSGTRSPSPMAPATEPAALIVAHGQPSAPEGAERAIAALARAVAAVLPGWRVRGATLAAPGALEAALAALGSRPVPVYPHFMSDGWFVRTRIPQRLAAAGRADCEVLAPFGRDPASAELCLRAAREGALEHGLDPAATTLLIAAHGSPVRSPARRRDPRRGRGGRGSPALPGRRRRFRGRAALDRRGGASLRGDALPAVLRRAQRPCPRRRARGARRRPVRGTGARSDRRACRSAAADRRRARAGGVRRGRLTRDPADDGRWPVWRLAVLLYPFAAAAAAINVFLLALLGRAVGLASLSPSAALALGALLGVPAAWWSGCRLRALMDQAEGH